MDKLTDLPLKEIIRLIELDCYVVGSLQYLFLERWEKRKEEFKSNKFVYLNLDSN